MNARIKVAVVSALAAAGALFAANYQPAHANVAIIATFDVQGEQFRVRIENEATIEQVRALGRGEGTASIPNGRLLRGSDGNEPWSWHLDPQDIEMTEVAIELCDGTPSLVEADLDYWVDTVQRFCPWTAKLVGIEDISDTIGICIDTIGSFDPRQIEGTCVDVPQGKDAVLVTGRALLDFTWLGYGRPVEARVNGQTCGSTTMPAGDGTFMLTVNGAGVQDGCAAPGQRVDFYVYGVQAMETMTWPSEHDGGPVVLSLTAITSRPWYWFERISNPRPAVGAFVQAYVGDTICAEVTIGGESDAKGYFIPEGIRGFSRMVLESIPQCSVNGALVEFRVDGLRAETAVVWRPGLQRLNLMVQGDANCDFLVDSRDATLALQVTAALLSGVPCHADADRDGDIDVFDARHILEFAAGITNALPL